MLRIITNEAPPERSFSCKVTIFNGKYNWQRPWNDYTAHTLDSAGAKAIKDMVGEYQKVHEEKIERLYLEIRCTKEEK